MRELQEVTDYNELFSPGYDEPLLQYVGVLGEKYSPLNDDDKEYGFWVSKATGNFARSYLQNKIDKSKLKEYLKNEDIQNTIKSLGYDAEKFWYLLLFVNDFTIGVCKEGIKFNESPKEQIYKLLKSIDDNSKLINNEISFTKPIKIVIEGLKPKIIMDNPLAIQWLASICCREYKNIEDGSELTWCMGGNKIEHNPLADSKQIWYFAKMFLSFFDLRKPQKIKLKNGDSSTNKKLLVSRLIYLMGLTANENFLDSDDSLKGFLAQYKNFKVERFNIKYA